MLPHYRPKTKGSHDLGMEPQKLWVKTKLFCLLLDYFRHFVAVMESWLIRYYLTLLCRLVPFLFTIEHFCFVYGLKQEVFCVSLLSLMVVEGFLHLLFESGFSRNRAWYWYYQLMVYLRSTIPGHQEWEKKEVRQRLYLIFLTILPQRAGEIVRQMCLLGHNEYLWTE